MTLSEQSDVLRCCLPDETHSEQLISSALTRFSLKWPSLNCLMYEGAVYQPDETHSEQLLSSALTRFSLRWPSLNCLMYEGAVYQMRPIQNSSSFLLCSPECLYICWDPNYFKCPSLNCLMYEMKVLSPRWDPFRTAHLFCSAHQIVSTVSVTLSKLSDVWRCCQPDENYSEQLLTSALLTKVSLHLLWRFRGCKKNFSESAGKAFSV